MGKKVQVAQLDEARMKQVQALERELGVWLVALEPEAQPASLSDEQLKKLQAKEKELGVVLVAYQHPDL
jgi:hypothetical protein